MEVILEDGNVTWHKHGGYTIIDVRLDLYLDPDAQPTLGKTLALIELFRVNPSTKTSRRYHLCAPSGKKDCVYDRLHLMSDWYAKDKKGELASVVCREDALLPLSIGV